MASRINLADEIQILSTGVVDHEFVQAVKLVKEHAPAVFLYTADQITDIRRFCSSDAPDEIKSVLT